MLAPAVSHLIFSLLQVIIEEVDVPLNCLNQLFVAQHIQDLVIGQYMDERTRKSMTKPSDEFGRLLKKSVTKPSQPSVYGSKRKLASAVRDKSRRHVC